MPLNAPLFATPLNNPDDLARKRKIAEALMSVQPNPQNMWQGIQSAIGQIGGSVQETSLDQAEKAAQTSYGQQYAGLGDSPTRSQLEAVAGDPWGNSGQQAIVNALLGQNIQSTDPTTQADLALKGAQTGQINMDMNKPIAVSRGFGQPDVLVDPHTFKPVYDPGSGANDLSPATLDMIATQYLAGDKSVISGYSRNPTMRAQIANAVAAKAASLGMDGKGIAAEISAYGGNVAAQRAAGTRAAQVGMAASEADKMADIALQASKTVPRGSLVPWNTLTNAVATGTSSPQMAAFVTATTSLVNAYARAVSPLGAPTDAMRQHAEQMLNTAQSPEAYAAVIAQMKNEMSAALNAPAEISKSLKSSITGNSDQFPADQFKIEALP